MRAALDLTTSRDLAKVVVALERFRDNHDRYPEGLQELVGPIPTSLLNIYDQSDGRLVPRLYQYRLSTDGASYDLFAIGADGRTGTSDDIRPQLGDSLRSHSGYREGLR